MQATVLHSQVEVFHLQGHLNAARAEELQHQLSQVVSSSCCDHLLIDLAKVESMDSAGLMAFVSAQRLAQQLGRSLNFCGISPSVRIILELTQLDQVFQIFADRAEFLADTMPAAA